MEKRYEFPWPSDSVVSTGGQLGPASQGRGQQVGYYLWGWDGTGTPTGNALFFVPQSGKPTYTPAEWNAGYTVNVGSAAEADRIVRLLASRGELIGRPGTIYEGGKVGVATGTGYGALVVQDGSAGPMSAPGAASGSGGPAMSGGTSNGYGNWWGTPTQEGTTMGQGFDIRSFIAFLRTSNYSRYLLSVTGSAAGVVQDDSPQDVVSTAITAASGEATAAGLTSTEAFRAAQQEILEAWNLFVQQEKTIAMLEAFASGNMWMAMLMAMGSGGGLVL